MKKSLNYIIHLFFILLPYLNILLYLRGFYDFEIAKYFYFANILLLFPLFFYDIKRKVYLGFWIFILPFMYTLPWIVLGLDMTDEAFSLAVSWFYPIKGSFIISASPVSYFLSHLWLKIAGAPYILWERLAVNTILSLVLFFSYKTLRLLKEDVSDRWGFILIIYMAMAIISYHYRFFTPYDKIPIVLLVIYSYLWIKSFKDNNRIILILLGIIFILLLYSKITYFIFISILTAILLIKIKTIKISYFLFGVIVGLFFIYFFKIDFFYFINSFKDSKFCFISDTHNLEYLFILYIKDSLKSLFAIVFILISFYFLCPTSKPFNFSINIKKINVLFIFFTIFILLYFTNKYLLHNNKIPIEFYYLYLNIWIALSIIMFSLSINFLYWKEKIYILYIISFILILSFVGSNVGFVKIYLNYAIAYILPIFIFIDKKKCEKIFFILLFLLIVIAIFYNLNYNRREYPTKELKEQFEINIVRGVYSSFSKVNEINSFYSEIKLIPIKEKRYITLNKSFLFSLLLNKKPYALCWEDDIIKVVNNESINFVIFAATNISNPIWDKVKDNNIKDKKILDLVMYPVIVSPKEIFILYKK